MESSRRATAKPEGRLREIRREAVAIYAALFHGAVPERVARRYEAALASLPLDPVPVTDEGVWASPERLAAVEYFLRTTRGKNGLSQRFQVVFYMAELEPELFPRFARSSASRLSALLDLGRASVAASWYFGRGLWWWRRCKRA